ncbi:hypothetical protein COW94_00730 [Candidatus Peregrinibacteria bacterium CG22_combo_CG10-13_8_21_14_all_44_10]|nr:MAG: hypothetical protein AUK45_01830 [Candidatus Peregrinibacteria bacterium CG2_30_44_17]PIP66620.1 MAG: hypothetical protein COW94_00730 [Candidatus Peregrinibacteria bacterium CG22_combo_CG10-13_8_21_14_all_44_10]PIS04418.1 MAG: hypothetical protein COT83_00670 [Candidatus Peregrinibacteria bacterium CG10_big_fil_rev_8_21_14_0_10_44_7]PIX79953.1 MAG: hypothetical protein COZ35_02325 [Candidatus Peregrinibacteria bacterium CG_4_10_14_3_um_filter_44_21]PJB88315.1 MAG: hypothetical protein 
MDENTQNNGNQIPQTPPNPGGEQPKIYINEKTVEEHKEDVAKAAEIAKQQQQPQVVTPAPAVAPASAPTPQSTPAPAPTPVVVTTPQPAPAAQPAVAPAPKTPEQALTPEQKKALQEKKKRAKKKKAITAGIVTGGIVFVLIIVMIFLLLTQGGGADNPLLKMFGISEENFYPFLITLTNVIFGMTIFVTFIVGIIGLFKVSMTKKDDKAGKNKGIMMAILGGSLFVILAFAWTFTYMYLSSQQVETQTAQDTSIIKTDPEDLSNLTAPATITFDASQIPFNPYQYKLISFEWDFGDGSTATGETVSHRYTTKGPDAGRYEVVLTVTYEDVETGEEATEQIILDVIFSNDKVAASFTVDQEKGDIPLTVEFDASGSVDPDGEIVSYEWDLDGDGKFDDGEDVTAEYTYEQAGTYEVSLRVTDNNGDYNVVTMDIAAGGVDVVAVIGSDNDEYYTGVSYSFSAADSESINGEITKYTWDFGDGSNDVKTRTAKHTYEEAGNYLITLEVEDEVGETGKTKIEITVIGASEKPVAVIMTDPEANSSTGVVEGEVPLEVIFDASSSVDADDNIVDYEWDFDGNGDTDDTGEKVTYTYEKTGAYIASLTVIDADGNTNTETIAISVSGQALDAALTVTPTSGEVPMEVEFSAAGSTYPDGEIVAYTWDFGDGSDEYVGGAEVTYEYDTVGTFTATVTVLADDNSEDSDSITITVRPVTLTACFEASLEQGKAPLIVAFDPLCSGGSIQSYVWDFGDGDKSYDRKPTHTFDEVGIYTVELEVEDAGGVKDTYELEITVTSE